MYNSCKKVKEEKMNHGKQSSLIKEKKDQLANASNTQVDVKKRVSRKRIQTLAAKERDCNLNKKNVHVSATVTQSQGSTSKKEEEQHDPLNFSTLTQKKTTDEVVSRKTQDLKRKFTITAPTNNEEYGDFNKNLVEERGKMRKFSVVSIDNFLEINKEHHDAETLAENEDEDDIEEQEEGDVNPIDIEDEENTNITEGMKVKKTRGKTQCLDIHARSIEDRVEVIFDDDGEPIGPTNKVVSDLSYFLGTIARNCDFCPLTYTNSKAIPDKNSIWEFVSSKFIIPDKGKKVVLARINDAWRRYKADIRKNHFLKYKNISQMLKDRPKGIPESHFRNLIAYWKNEDVKKMCQQNARNRAQQKFRHRMGPINFARIRARLCAKKENNEQPSQAEMFIETRKGTKEKQLDEDTLDVITHLHNENRKSRESAIKAFQTLFGKEKPGRVRCYRRVTTPTMLKRSEEIDALKRQHANEKASLEGKVDTMQQEMDELKSLVKILLQQNSGGLDMEALAARLGCTSSGANNEKEIQVEREKCLNDMEHEDQIVNEE